MATGFRSVSFSQQIKEESIIKIRRDTYEIKHIHINTKKWIEQKSQEKYSGERCLKNHSKDCRFNFIRHIFLT